MGQIVTDSDAVSCYLGLTDATSNEVAVIMASVNRAEAAIKEYLKYDPVQKARIEYYPNRNLMMNQREGIWEVDANSAYLRWEAAPSTDELQLRHIPIRSISALYIDYDARSGAKSGSFSSDTLKTEGTDFWPNYDMEDSAGNKICMDGILRSFGRWPTEPGSVKVQYTAGYSASEFLGQGYLVDASAIYEAVIHEAARRAKQAFLDGKGAGSGVGSSGGWTAGQINSERLGDYSYSQGSSVGGSGSTSSTFFGGINSLLPQTKETLRDFVNYGWALMS